MKFLGNILILAMGIFVGLIIARQLPTDSPTRTVIEAKDTSLNPPQDPTQLAPATLVLRISGERQNSTSLATLVKKPNLVVAAIRDFVGAEQLIVESAHGQRVRIDSVVVADERNGLALLRTTEGLLNIDVLQPEAGAGTLSLGRDVLLQTPSRQFAGQVNSPATQDELGAYRYTIKTDRITDGGAAAIVDPESNRLLGLVERGSAGQFSAAVEVAAINALLSQAPQATPVSLDEFSDFFYNETTIGRLTVLERFVSNGEFSSAIQYGKTIRNLDNYTLKSSDPLLEAAYAGGAKNAFDQQQWQRVVNLASDAEQLIGLKDSLRLVRAQAYQSAGQPELAVSDLMALGNPDSRQVRIMIVDNIKTRAQQNTAASTAMLERALVIDPGYAQYHRLLGETLERQGNISGALAALENAISLDPGLQSELSPLLSRLRARRNTPVLTEVPIQRRRSTMYVDARINGSGETFRFLFDTGASYTAITSETALRLGINDIFFGAPVVRLQTANGEVFTTTAKLGSIDVAGARVDNVEAVILESMNGVDGLLGQSFLRHFDVNIDRTRGVIAFSRRLGE